jgi:serine/threonine protein phosphatase PrpC
MILHTPLFRYGFQAAAMVDIGRKRSSNQDAVITCPEYGFYAVSDGMGGLPNDGGGVTSDTIRQVLPLMIRQVASLFEKRPDPEYAAKLLEQQVRLLSDQIYDTGNNKHMTLFGATLSGVWLAGKYAMFVNLGDSRGYHLPHYKKMIMKITRDHNVAAILVELGKLTRLEAFNHPSSSQLVQYAGMAPPAKPDVFIREVRPGDRLLLCSDGQYGMIDEMQLHRLMRSARYSPDKICRNLIKQANLNGGHDNISAVYLKITK